MQMSCFSRRECMTFTDVGLSTTNILQMRAICPHFHVLFPSSSLLTLLSPSSLLLNLGWIFFYWWFDCVQNWGVSCYSQVSVEKKFVFQLRVRSGCRPLRQIFPCCLTSIMHPRALGVSKMLLSGLSSVREHQAAVLHIFVLGGV